MDASRPPRPDEEAGGGRLGAGGGGPEDGGGGGGPPDGGGGGGADAGAGAAAAGAGAGAYDADADDRPLVVLAMCLDPRLFWLRVRRATRWLREDRGEDRDLRSACFFFSRAASAEPAPPPLQCSSNSKKSRNDLDEMCGL